MDAGFGIELVVGVGAVPVPVTGFDTVEGLVCSLC